MNDAPLEAFLTICAFTRASTLCSRLPTPPCVQAGILWRCVNSSHPRSVRLLRRSRSIVPGLIEHASPMTRASTLGTWRWSFSSRHRLCQFRSWRWRLVESIRQHPRQPQKMIVVGDRPVPKHSQCEPLASGIDSLRRGPTLGGHRYFARAAIG